MDEALPGGRMSAGVVRRGTTVRRPMGPWSGSVHAFLRHLESAGFAGAPRFLGMDGDREILSYLPGDVPVDPEWQPGRGLRLTEMQRSPESLAATARLLRELHEAATGFMPTAREFRFHPYPARPGEVMAHGDLGPWNTVYRDGAPIAFIDWDACRPMERLVDLALAAWAFVPLGPRRRLAEAGFDPVPDIGERLRLFVDTYGGIDRDSVFGALQEAVLLQANRVRYWELGPADTAAALEFHAAELRWLGGAAERLQSALR
ncbi:MAG TPA: phosphotransferase [Mycobacteriales bacterium]|nr:phosphotransferase [Mycobacteriales bacterium]